MKPSSPDCGCCCCFAAAALALSSAEEGTGPSVSTAVGVALDLCCNCAKRVCSRRCCDSSTRRSALCLCWRAESRARGGTGWLLPPPPPPPPAGLSGGGRCDGARSPPPGRWLVGEPCNEGATDLCERGEAAIRFSLTIPSFNDVSAEAKDSSRCSCFASISAWRSVIR